MIKFAARWVRIIIFSWVVIHVLAFLGIFIALAYPLWWLFSPFRLECLACRLKKTTNCRFSHALISMALLLIFTAVSLGLVFAERQALLVFGFLPAAKTAYFSIPPKGQYRLGEIFPVKVDVAGINQPVNAVQADLSFDPEKLEVVEISTTDSFATIFIQKEINNLTGHARLTGGLPNPGYFSNHGLFGTFLLRGKSPGIAKVQFLPSSMVLANDGRGSNILKEFAAVSYLILPEKISPGEEKLQKDVTIDTTVLGESSDKTQMTFYSEEPVLGVNTPQEVPTTKSLSWIEIILEQLENLDNFILTQWSKVIKFGR